MSLHIISGAAVPSYISTNCVQVSVYSQPDTCYIFIEGILTGMSDISLAIICRFLLVSNVEHMFVYLLPVYLQ